MSFELKKKISTSSKIFVGSSLASFSTMIVVQYFMGGVGDVGQIIRRAVMIGAGLALLVFVVPKREEKYPWQ